MRYNKFLFIFIVVCIYFFSACKQLKVNEEAIFDPQNKESEQILTEFEQIGGKVDQIFQKRNFLVELYYQENNSDELVLTPSLNDLSVDKLKIYYNIIRYEDGKLMYAAEFPLSKSGDWDIIYESFFDDKGNLVAFTRKCSFFNSGCADIAREKSEYFYTPSHKLIKKTYLIMDGNDKPLRYQDCVFNYRFPYTIYKTTKQWLKHHPIKK